jgi:aminoglycoside 6-adenylyltransferase
MSSASHYQSLERQLAAWAHTQPAIQAIIVVGSQARSVHPADEWSDLDVVIFASETTAYLHDAAWLSIFGTVHAVVADSFGQRDREWIAVYADGTKLDAALLSIDPAATPTLQTMIDTFPYPTVLQRGVRVLVDKTGAAGELRLPALDPRRPTPTDFVELLNRMWLDAMKTAKFIRRHDLWRAKRICDGQLKQHVLTLLEWQAATQPDRRDIWYDGRFLAEWADREAVAALPTTFATYSQLDLKRALFATLDLFRQLAQDVARRLEYAYPFETDRALTAQIGAILQGDE